MAKYTGNILTNLGKDLLARAVIGGEVLTFTKVELGKGVIAGGNQEEFTELIDSFKVLPITSTAKLEGGSYRVRAAFSNSGIVEDTYLREIGVFARGEDGVEILYSYCNTDTPDLIPAEGAGVLERVEDVITYISNAANINAVIDQSKVYATIKDITEGLALKEDKFSKNTAFNKNKSNSYSSSDSETLATSKALKDGLATTFKTSDCYYGIGDYWITESIVNPATKWLGTTWKKVEDRMLLGSGLRTVASEGGREAVTLGISNIPRHRFQVDSFSLGRGSMNIIGSVGSACHGPSGGVYGSGSGAFYTSSSDNNGAHGYDTYGTNYRTLNFQASRNWTGFTSTASPYTNYQGNDEAFSILNPYRIINIWRRIT